MLMSEKSPQCILTCSACPGSRGVGGGALLQPAAGARKLILSIIQLHTSLSGNKASHYLPTQTISEHRGHHNTNTTPLPAETALIHSTGITSTGESYYFMFSHPKILGPKCSNMLKLGPVVDQVVPNVKEITQSSLSKPKAQHKAET